MCLSHECLSSPRKINTLVIIPWHIRCSISESIYFFIPRRIHTENVQIERINLKIQKCSSLITHWLHSHISIECRKRIPACIEFDISHDRPVRLLLSKKDVPVCSVMIDDRSTAGYTHNMLRNSPLCCWLQEFAHKRDTFIRKDFLLSRRNSVQIRAGK